MRAGEEVFHEWYAPNGIGSGHGSSPAYTERFRDFLHAFMRAHDIQSIVDVGCGDWQWARFVDWGDRSYRGFDIVPALVERLRSTFGRPNRTFEVITNPETFVPPQADLLICKDVLQHLSNEDVRSMLARFGPTARHILWINDRDPNPQWNNSDTVRGGYRRLDLSKPPFNVPGEVVYAFRHADNKVVFWQNNTASTVSAFVNPPRVAVAILAKQKERILEHYLECIENLDYPKKAISLYVRTNNNTDRTASILESWLRRVGHEYERVLFDPSDVAIPVEKYDVHEWNVERFKVLGEIRQRSLDFAREHKCDFYFTADVDNFIVPETLTELVRANLPIAAPLLRHKKPELLYSNFHAAVDPNGYYADTPNYLPLVTRAIRGLIEVPVVHCTYLVRWDALPLLTYDDGSGRYEYVIFSDSARRANVPQYLDTRRVYGILTLDEDDTSIRERMANLRATDGEYIFE